MKTEKEILTFLQFCAANYYYSIDIPDRVVQEFLESGTDESSEERYKDALERLQILEKLMPNGTEYISLTIIKAIIDEALNQKI